MGPLFIFSICLFSFDTSSPWTIWFFTFDTCAIHCFSWFFYRDTIASQCSSILTPSQRQTTCQFGSAYAELSIKFKKLKKQLGSKHAVSLFSRGSFCASYKTILYDLNRLLDEIGTNYAIQLFANNSFLQRNSCSTTR